MALKDNRINNSIIKIVPGEDTVFSSLHPKYPFTFLSLFGKVYNIENVMLFLNRVNFPISKLSEKLSDIELKRITKSEIKHVPNYWYLIKLITADRILADKNLIKEILDTNDIKNMKFVVYNEIKSGIITKLEPDQKLLKYSRQTKGTILTILDIANTEKINSDNIELMSKEDYKEFKNKVKQTIFNSVEERVNGNIAEGVTDINNELLLKEYLR